MTTEQTLAFRLARIMGEVGRVEKKGKITSQGSGPTYKFARDSDVMEAVTPKMAEAGIVMIPEHVELLSMGLSLSEKQFIGNIKTSWHVTDGKESLRFETFGQGADTGDKALPKAQSNARKYAFFMLYHIVTGDDPDYHGSYEQPERGERAPKREAQPPSRSAAPAPVQPTRYRRDELADLMADHNLNNATVEVMAANAGIPPKERPMSDVSMDRLIDHIREAFIEQPGSGVPSAPAGGGVSSGPAADNAMSEGSPDSSGSDAATPTEAVPPPSQSAAPNDLMDDILAVTNGEEVTPEPGTVQDAILRAEAKAAKAKVRA
jgi:hypothetical protein